MAQSQSKTYVAPLDVTERVLADGRVITPGEPFELSASDQNDDHNRRLIEEGKFSEATSAKSTGGGE
jgi:hypothetical protein